MLTILTTLSVAGLVAPSTGLSIDARQNISITLPNFHYESEKNAQHEKLHLIATEGTIPNGLIKLNESNWRSSLGHTLTQTPQKFLQGKYNVQASSGDVTVKGTLTADFTTLNLTVELSATGDETHCKLEPKVSVFEGDFEVVVLDSLPTSADWWVVSEAFSSDVVVKAVKAVLWKEVAGELPAKLTDLVQKALMAEPETKMLCRDMISVGRKNFARPEISIEWLKEYSIK